MFFIKKLKRMKNRAAAKLILKSAVNSLIGTANKFGGIEGEFDIGQSGVVKICTKNVNDTYDNPALKVEFKKAQPQKSTKKILTVALILVILLAVLNKKDKN
ncbi:MAG: hypothetical protein LBM87_08395 [Ruminococcus sp.]|jgi:hypothetical protein|nr:hypothetical protein [Ruminococcus sp.]